MASWNKIPIEKMCYKCGKKAVLRERSAKIANIERYVCRKHYREDYYVSVVKNDPSSWHKIRKSISDRRTGNLNPNSNYAFGDDGEELTCIWRGVKNLNKELDCYNTPIDHSMDHELGIVQTKIKRFDPKYLCWHFSNIDHEHDKEFDNLILWCTNEKKDIVERLYIILKEEIIGTSVITIVKNSFKGVQWYEKYRIENEEELKKINYIWQKIRRKRMKKEDDKD